MVCDCGTPYFFSLTMFCNCGTSWTFLLPFFFICGIVFSLFVPNRPFIYIFGKAMLIDCDIYWISLNIFVSELCKGLLSFFQTTLLKQQHYYNLVRLAHHRPVQQ